jgi:GDP-4-dehydro-6-deoxy-D-mannose reductase
MQRILITGASGFAGGHLIDRLAGRAALIGWHRPRTPEPGLRPDVTWRGVDLTDRDGVVRAIAEARPSCVYHIAGAARADATWASVTPHLQTNVMGTHHVLEGVRLFDPRCRVLVVSSAFVYRPAHTALTEHSPLVPANPYGLSKLAQDDLARRAHDDEGLDVVIARPFNHIGPRQSPSFSVPSFARQIAAIEGGRNAPEIHVGNLEARRDLTDVRDVVAAYERLMEAGVAGRAYNICSGRAIRIGDVLDQLIAMARVPVSVVKDPARMRPSDTPLLLGDSSRLREELGWAPGFSLDRTLRDTLEWWRGTTADGPAAAGPSIC